MRRLENTAYRSPTTLRLTENSNYVCLPNMFRLFFLLLLLLKPACCQHYICTVVFENGLERQ